MQIKAPSLIAGSQNQMIQNQCTWSNLLVSYHSEESFLMQKIILDRAVWFLLIDLPNAVADKVLLSGGNGVMISQVVYIVMFL